MESNKKNMHTKNKSKFYWFFNNRIRTKIYNTYVHLHFSEQLFIETCKGKWAHRCKKKRNGTPSGWLQYTMYMYMSQTWLYIVESAKIALDQVWKDEKDACHWEWFSVGYDCLCVTERNFDSQWDMFSILNKRTLNQERFSKGKFF